MYFLTSRPILDLLTVEPNVILCWWTTKMLTVASMCQLKVHSEQAANAAAADSCLLQLIPPALT